MATMNFLITTILLITHYETSVQSVQLGTNLGQTLGNAAGQVGQTLGNVGETLGNVGGQLGHTVGDVAQEILDQQQALQNQIHHFVGKLNVFGTLKHIGRKTSKALKPENPNLLVWNGTVKLLRGTLATDVPEKLGIPLNIANLSLFGRGCLKPGKQYPNHGSYHPSAGPKEDGLDVNDFEACSERQRGTKIAGISFGRTGAFEGRRLKRSESYSYPSMLWKNPNNIPYAIDSSVSAAVKTNILAAIEFWTKHTCLSFNEITNPTSQREPYILFVSKSGSCSTDNLGPKVSAPFATTVDLALCGNLIGSISHEIGHALGLSHSQKRVDRDASVKIYSPNVAVSWESQFEIDSSQYFDGWGVPYYYDSIMHYFPYAASKNGLMTICPMDPLMEVIMGQREEPAFGDISLLNRIYCQESCFSQDQLRGMQFTGTKSRTISGRLCQNWSTQSPQAHRFTSVGNHNYCRNPDGWTGGPWCFTTDPNVRYEPCFSPCETLNSASKPACNGWCYNGGYHDPSTCQCVCPRYTEGQFCEKINTKLLHAHIPCGGKIELKTIGQKAAISSPNWPTNYTENTVCMWWIESPRNSRVKLTVLDFMLEIADDTGCYDYLEIRPSICASAIEKPEKMRFCGNSLASNTTASLKQLYSDDHNMVLKFFSDHGDSGRGFSIIAEAVPAPQ